MRAALTATSGVRGVLLVGPAGVGKTTLARSATAASGRSAHWTAASASARDIPLGLFAHLLTVPATAEPITLLGNAFEAIRAARYGVIGVDDVHLADHLSAVLLHQLAVEGAARIIATARDGEPMPETITALWKDGYLARVDVTAFSRSEVVALAEAALGGRLEELSADAIWQSSGGNALYVRQLLEGARTAGSLREVDGVWQLRGELPVTTELAELIGGRLDALSDEPNRILRLLALSHPLDVDVLAALGDPGALELLEPAGLVAVTDDPDGATVDFAHAVIGETVRQRIGTLAARQLSGELLAVLSSRPHRTPAERIRLAELALAAGDAADTGLLMRAAADAIALTNLDSAERLSRAAQLRGGGFAASELVARSLLLQGRNREADAVLDGFDPETLTEFELAQWGITRVANLRWSIGDADAAERILAMVRHRLTHPTLRLVLDGLRSALLVLDAHLDQGAALAEEVLTADGAPAVAVGWAVFAAATAAALTGRTADAMRLAERGRAVYGDVDALLRFLLTLGEVRVLTLIGEFDVAQARSGDLVRITSPNQFRARAMAQALAATVEVARGDLRAATRRLQENLAALSGEGAVAWNLPAKLLLAQCYCALGLDDPAGALVAELVDEVGRGGGSFVPSVRITEAWLAAAEGHLSAATATAVHAADLAAERGQRAIELMALHAAARFGDRSCLPRLLEVAESVGGPLAGADAAHAVGLMNGDPTAVLDAALDFERIGALLSAADAAAQAAALFDAAGDRRHTLEAEALAERLARRCGGLQTPAIRARSQPLPLSDREREIAHLVAHGLSNREIAEKLVLSRRTVENHLYRIFAKLDVTRREDLAAVMRRGD